MKRNCCLALLGATCLLGGCEGFVTRDCETLHVPLLDASTWDGIVNAQVTIALTNDLGGRSAAEYLQAFGEPHEPTTEFSDVDLTVCGVCTAVDFVTTAFYPDYTLAVLGIQRSAESPVEIVVIEFDNPTTPCIGEATPVIRNVTSETIVMPQHGRRPEKASEETVSRGTVRHRERRQ